MREVPRYQDPQLQALCFHRQHQVHNRVNSAGLLMLKFINFRQPLNYHQLHHCQQQAHSTAATFIPPSAIRPPVSAIHPIAQRSLVFFDFLKKIQGRMAQEATKIFQVMKMPYTVAVKKLQ